MRVDLRQTLMGWRWLIPASLVLELMMHNMWSVYTIFAYGLIDEYLNGLS